MSDERDQQNAQKQRQIVFPAVDLGLNVLWKLNRIVLVVAESVMHLRRGDTGLKQVLNGISV